LPRTEVGKLFVEDKRVAAVGFRDFRQAVAVVPRINPDVAGGVGFPGAIAGVIVAIGIAGGVGGHLVADGGDVAGHVAIPVGVEGIRLGARPGRAPPFSASLLKPEHHCAGG